MNFSFLNSSDIRDKYFYRTGNWTWLTKDQIHVVDSNSPRMVTMDAWPQQVYLDASGQKTVKEYIHDFADMYPPDEVPAALDKTIIQVLTNLVKDGGLVQLSDAPKKLDFELHKPLDDTTSIDIRGKWRGHYTYSIPDGVNADLLKKVEFIMNITNVLGHKFYGTVEDNATIGGTPGIGKVEGVLEGNSMRFEKKMPVYAGIDAAGNRFTDETKKHPTITYEGMFLEKNMSVKGAWKFKEKVTIRKWFIPIKVSAGNGHFEMVRSNEV